MRRQSTASRKIRVSPNFTVQSRLRKSYGSNRAARAYAFLAFLESKPEILVTSSSNASVSAPRKSLTIIQTLVIVGAAGLIASLLVKLLV
jgi:hypothetical protein